MTVEVHLLSQSKPMTFKDVENAYTKDAFFCVYQDGVVFKFPLVNIFRVKESYE